MKTITIQIGNSDNKLRQVEWADFIHEVDEAIKTVATNIHFAGGSDPRACWQNFCWVFNAPFSSGEGLKLRLQQIKQKFRQDAIAVTPGETKFV